jgi:hypothetical protein
MKNTDSEVKGTLAHTVVIGMAVLFSHLSLSIPLPRRF